VSKCKEEQPTPRPAADVLFACLLAYLFTCLYTYLHILFSSSISAFISPCS